MTAELDIHAASPDEQVAAHTNVFDIWSKGLSLADHNRHRQNAPMHRRATWFVGCLEGRVVTSLASYPVRFRVSDKELPGIAIGSVYTLAEFRGRGFAPQLLQWVENHQQQRNQTALSVLYSDIGSKYYAALGYALCPSLEGWRDPREPAPAAPAEYRLVSAQPQSQLEGLKKLYAAYHGATPLSIARDDAYWSTILERARDDRFFALEDRHGSWAGYVRVAVKDHTWRIVDFALTSQAEDLLHVLYATLVTLARGEGAARLGGWLPAEAAAKEWFQVAPRRTEITMIKALAWPGTLDDTLLLPTGRFCEIDHV